MLLADSRNSLTAEDFPVFIVRRRENLEEPVQALPAIALQASRLVAVGRMVMTSWVDENGIESRQVHDMCGLALLLRASGGL